MFQVPLFFICIISSNLWNSLIKIVYFYIRGLSPQKKKKIKEEAYRAEVWRGSKPGASRHPLLGRSGSWRVSPSPTPSVWQVTHSTATQQGFPEPWCLETRCSSVADQAHGWSLLPAPPGGYLLQRLALLPPMAQSPHHKWYFRLSSCQSPQANTVP